MLLSELSNGLALWLLLSLLISLRVYTSLALFLILSLPSTLFFSALCNFSHLLPSLSLCLLFKPLHSSFSHSYSLPPLLSSSSFSSSPCSSSSFRHPGLCLVRERKARTPSRKAKTQAESSFCSLFVDSATGSRRRRVLESTAEGPGAETAPGDYFYAGTS